MAIREILEEELENSLRMERNYSQAVDRLPKGSLVRKRIGGGEYLYLAKRVGQKVEFAYLGKPEPRLIEKYEQAKMGEARSLPSPFALGLFINSYLLDNIDSYTSDMSECR